MTVGTKPTPPAPPSFDVLADSALVRACDIARGRRDPSRPVLMNVAASTFWRMVRDGQFPAPVKIGAMSCWKVGDVRQWLADQAAGVQAPPKPRHGPAAMKAQPAAKKVGRPATSSLAIIKALRAGPQTTAQMEAVGGSRVTARVHELRKAGYQITTERAGEGAPRNSSIYRLVAEPLNGGSHEA